jgi:hypothetical protein
MSWLRNNDPNLDATLTLRPPGALRTCWCEDARHARYVLKQKARGWMSHELASQRGNLVMSMWTCFEHDDFRRSDARRSTCLLLKEEAVDAMSWLRTTTNWTTLTLELPRRLETLAGVRCQHGGTVSKERPALWMRP